MQVLGKNILEPKARGLAGGSLQGGLLGGEGCPDPGARLGRGRLTGLPAEQGVAPGFQVQVLGGWGPAALLGQEGLGHCGGSGEGTDL